MSLHSGLAPTPPMGWNSFDCFGNAVLEEEVVANAEYMARNLKNFGWQYVVIDAEWYVPSFKPKFYHHKGEHLMDEYGRFVPDPGRFPSVSGGKGFKPLSDFIHSMCLKFGIHIMRGIPQTAVEAGLPVLGTNLTAPDISTLTCTSGWVRYMFGVDASKPHAQAYYDSIIRMYADWGVDYIKADDMSYPYAKGEIELIRRAIDECGRDIVLSLSPGRTPIEEAEHVKANSELWRVSADLWDRGREILTAFDLAATWAPHSGPGHWPDLDMLPLGHIEIYPAGECIGHRWTRLTPDEQVAMMTLWCMLGSPLMFGGNMPDNDEWTLSILTNKEVLRVLNKGQNRRELLRNDEHVLWTADGDGCRYLAAFNLQDKPSTIQVPLGRRHWVRDLWQRKDIGEVEGSVSVDVPPHGVRLFKVLVC